MTRRQRDELKEAIDQAKRAWLEQQGGYNVVERCAAGHDRAIGIHKPKPKRCSPVPDWQHTIYDLRDQGLSLRAIAIEAGRSYWSVHKVLERRVV